MYGVPDFYQNDNVKKGTGMQWRHQVVSDLPSIDRHQILEGTNATAFSVSSERHWQGGVNGIAKVPKRSEKFLPQRDSNH